MSTRSTHQEERRAYADFASSHAEEDFRSRLDVLYTAWRRFNEHYFDKRLVEPHLAIGRTAPRSLAHCAETTEYGGHLHVVLNAGLVFGTNPAFVVNPWRPEDDHPASGTQAFIEDLLLRLTVKQAVLELQGDNESGYRGFGPRFTDEANRIGGLLFLPPVVERNRGGDNPSPLARGWPHCVRPASYYGDDVTEHALDLARGLAASRGGAREVTTQGILELILYRLQNGRAAEAQQMLERHLGWLRRTRGAGFPPRRRAERGSEDVEGKAPGEVIFHRAWLDWNSGTVLRIARAIYSSQSFIDLPILADALTDAGCGDDRILGHLRAEMEHSRRCWVLRLLLALGAE
jgi:hypothetical protein